GALHRLGTHRLAGRRVAQGLHALPIWPGHDRVPGRHTVEYAMRVDQVLVLRDIQPQPEVEDRPSGDGDAGAIRSGTRLEGLFEPVQVVLPPVGVLELLRHEVVNGRAARPARHLLGYPARCGDSPRGAATDLEDARAQFSQHTPQGPALSIWGNPCRVSPACWGRAEPERAGPHAVADQLLHGSEFLR